MAYYQYYQSGGPWQNAWGTNAYQFQAPPVPTYMPQASWRGADYYNAHYGGQSQDSTFFDYIWSKVNRHRGDLYDEYDDPETRYRGQVRSFVGDGGVSRGEAEHWHRRVYGGLVQIHQLLPREIGAAAGWETLRLWQSHRSIYSSPLHGEQEREREAIIGLAIAEAARLWQYVGRPLDKYGRREAGEVAASTAARIFMKMYGYSSPYDSYRSGRWGGSELWSDDEDNYRHHRSRSFNGGSDYGGSAYGGGSVYGGSNYGSISPYAGTLSPYATSAPIAVPGAGAAYGYGTGMATSPYLGVGGMGGAMSYPNNYMYGQQAMATSPGTLIVTPSRPRRHRSHSRSHGHHRSRSRSSVSYVPTAYSSGSYY